MKLSKFLLGVALCLVSFISNATVLPTKSILPANLALEMISASISKAKEMGLKVSITILDDSGTMKAFIRMDGAPTGSVEISGLKASTSAKLPVSSRILADKNATNPNHSYNHFPFVMTLPGGVPIKTASGEHLGGIGVSGASAEQDEKIAQAGIDKIKKSL
jgi:uncharacterized protein GlcG (DUF336 family)